MDKIGEVFRVLSHSSNFSQAYGNIDLSSNVFIVASAARYTRTYLSDCGPWIINCQDKD